MQQPPRTSTLAIAGFICAFVCSLLGLILSILGLREINASNGTVKGKGFAIAGIAVSVSFAAIGILAAVAIPAFMDYMKKADSSDYHGGDRSPVKVALNRVMKNAKVAYITDGRFPIGSTGLTPKDTCCTLGANNGTYKCPANSALWHDPTWEKLDFRIDEPGFFQYSYTSTDGKVAEIDAVGDLDCDTVMITYRMMLTSDGGNPSFTLMEPAPNSD